MIVNRHRQVVAVAVAIMICFPIVPLPLHAQAWVFDVVGTIALGQAWRIRLANAGRRGEGLTSVLVGLTWWLVGDWLYAALQGVDQPGSRPPASNACYLLGYAFLIAGVWRVVRQYRAPLARVWLLDSGIVCVGVGVPMIVFLVLPASAGQQPALARIVLAAYSLSDLFLVFLLARLVNLAGVARTATRLLSMAIASTLGVDLLFQALAVSGHPTISRWVSLGWLSTYLLGAAAVVHPSGSVPPSRDGTTDVSPSLRALFLLTMASILPGLTLLVQGAVGAPIAWATIGFGVVGLALLVLSRMRQLILHVQAQARQLRIMASVDSLTEVANRRAWDAELPRYCAVAAKSGSPLAVVMLDIDHFKAFNDLHGHQAGDQVLHEAALAWSTCLDPGQLLARYGGEEFSLLLPGCDASRAADIVQSMRARTPLGQSFSAGIAIYAAGSDPLGAVAEADAALFRAKRLGRDRIEAARENTSGHARC